MNAQLKSPLTRERIVDAALTLVEQDGPGALTMRRIGALLGVDATATYRHFSGKDELVRALGDRVIQEALEGHQPTEDWVENLRSICTLAYEAFCRHPYLTPLVTQSPARDRSEFQLTELVLEALRAGGFEGKGRALAYHALLELTVGIAVIDSAAATAEGGADALYDEWRSSYRAQPESQYPAIAQTVEHLYRDDKEQFAFALDLLLAGLRTKS